MEYAKQILNPAFVNYTFNNHYQEFYKTYTRFLGYNGTYPDPYNGTFPDPQTVPRAVLEQDHKLQDDESFYQHEQNLESEVFLKQIYGPYFCLPRNYYRIRLPVVPPSFIGIQTGEDGFTERVLGRGSFGKVVLGTLWYPQGILRDIVLKEELSATVFHDIDQEARVTMFLERTGYVPVCFGLSQSLEGKFRIVMECFGDGRTLLKALKEQLVPFSDAVQWLHIACQLANGLAKIHAMDVLINDVKEDNILIDLSKALPQIKYCDFGTSSYKRGTMYANPSRAVSPHLAPETCIQGAVTTQASDVYGLGRMLSAISQKTDIESIRCIGERCQSDNPRGRGTASEAYVYLCTAYNRATRRKDEDLSDEEFEDATDQWQTGDSESHSLKDSYSVGRSSISSRFSSISLEGYLSACRDAHNGFQTPSTESNQSKCSLQDIVSTSSKQLSKEGLSPQSSDLNNSGHRFSSISLEGYLSACRDAHNGFQTPSTESNQSKCSLQDIVSTSSKQLSKEGLSPQSSDLNNSGHSSLQPGPDNHWNENSSDFGTYWAALELLVAQKGRHITSPSAVLIPASESANENIHTRQCSIQIAFTRDTRRTASDTNVVRSRTVSVMHLQPTTGLPTGNKALTVGKTRDRLTKAASTETGRATASLDTASAGPDASSRASVAVSSSDTASPWTCTSCRNNVVAVAGDNGIDSKIDATGVSNVDTVTSAQSEDSYTKQCTFDEVDGPKAKEHGALDEADISFCEIGIQKE